MPTLRISKDCVKAFYFLTPTITNWYYLFDKYNRWQILSNSLQFFQKHRELEIYSYVFMLNHIHIIVKSPNIINFIRDFKKYTSNQLIKNIREYEPNILHLFANKKGGYNIWKPDNYPKILESEYFFNQKIDYIHHNPVVKGYVERPDYWKWSCANPNSEIKIIKIW